MEMGLKKTGFRLLLLCTLLGVFLALFLTSFRPAGATSGINQTVNFQGRLLNSSGATVPDGYYNIEFKIYQDGDGQSVGDTTGSPSGSLKWTEDYLNYNTQGVKVVNGYLSVNLGSINAFGGSIGTMYSNRPRPPCHCRKERSFAGGWRNCGFRCSPSN